MQVPILDLKGQFAALKQEIMKEIEELSDSQMFILGPKVAKFEEEIAAYCRAAGACGVTSGSDALLVSLMVEGIGEGDEVITTPFTFFATAGAIARVGAKPVFVDIDPETFNLDPSKMEEKITPRTKAVIPVHLFGQAAEMAPILEIAGRHNLIVIEDAAQAIGSEYKGQRVGSFGHYGCFSFFPSKNLGCFGDGGMVTANTPERVEKLKIFRNHGMNPKYYHKYIGGNFRLDALQAAILSIKLKHLDSWTEARQRNAAEYEKLLKTGKFKNFITSACPAVNRMIQLYYPEALQYLAPVDSPMLAHAKMIRARNKKAKVVFIGPCIAKRREAQSDPNTDFVMTFEELGALFAALEIDVISLNAEPLATPATSYARNFAHSCGVTEAILQEMSEESPDPKRPKIDGKFINGLDRKSVNMLKMYAKGKLPGNFVEVMACTGGCVGGPCSLAR